MQVRFTAVLTALLVSAASVVAGAPVSGAAEGEPERPIKAAEGKAPESLALQEDAVTAARKWKKPVVVDSMTGPQREVRALANGKLEATVHTTPVRTLRDGKWTPIDTTLRRQADGDLAPGATTVGLVFSGGGDQPFVRMIRIGRELSLTWPYGRLPAPVASGDTATYVNVLKDVDLVLRATPDGFSHVLRVKTQQAAALPQIAELKLKLGADRMRFSGDGEGGLKVMDQAAGGEVFRAPQPVMWDSSGQGAGTGAGSQSPSTVRAQGAGGAQTRGSGSVSGDLAEGPADGSRRAALKVSVGGGRLTLVPDQRLLSGAATRFPVFIDPDWKAPGESRAIMVGTSNTDASWEDEGIGLCDDADRYMSNCGGRVKKRLFYRFQLPGSAMNTNVLRAEFKPYNTHSYNCTASEAQVWKTKGVSASTSWAKQGVSGFWQRKLVVKDFAYGNEAVGCSNTTVTLTSGALTDEVHKTAHGSGVLWLGLKAGNESSTSGWKRFNDDAVLRVLYNLPPKTPTKLKLVAEGSDYECGWNDAAKPRVRRWPTMSALITDPQSSDRVMAEYLVGWGDVNGANFRWRIGGGWPIGGGLGPDTTPIYSGGGNSGSTFTKSLEGLAASRGIPKNTPIAWMVRGHDFQTELEDDNWKHWQGSSFWSDTATSNGGVGHACWFVYDDAAPPAPMVRSAKYPNDGAMHDGVGQEGAFTVTAGVGSEPLEKFGYQFIPPGKPAEQIQWLVLGKSKECTTATSCTFSKTPGVKGDWKLNVWAVDLAGRGGHAPTYTFRVRKVASEEAHWRLDDPVGSPSLRDEVVASDTYQFVSDRSGLCVTVEGASTVNGANIIQAPCEGSDSERWTLTSQPNDEYTLVNRKSNKCLNIIGGSLDDGAPAIQYDCIDVPENRWKRIEIAEHRYQLVSVNSGKCLNVAAASTTSGAHIIQWECIDVPENHWDLTSVNQAQLVGADILLGSHARVGSDALKLNSDGDAATVGYAETKQPVVDPTKSYSLSAWVKSNNPTVWGTIAAQEGSRMRALRLEQTSAGTWATASLPYDRDTENPVTRIQSNQPIKVGQWTHLVGSYNASTKILEFYVDGKLQGSGTYDGAGWASVSRGPFTIGRGLHLGEKRDYFPGEIDDVRVFDRPVTAVEVAGWYRPTVQARWRLNAPAGVDVTTADDSGAARDLTLHGGAEIATDEETCVDLTGQCLALDGRRDDGGGEWAQSSGPVVRTDGSFTVAGWVDAATPTVPMAVFSAAGSTQSAFTVRFNPRVGPNPNYDPDLDDPSLQYIKGWELEMPNGDTTTAARTTVYHGQSCNVCLNEGPDHLAVVYDADNDTMTLYVNGSIDQSATNSSSKDGVVGFHAGGSLQIGRRFADGQTPDTAANREYFSGLVDDVWVLKGALSVDDLPTFRNLQEVDAFHGNPQLPFSYD